MKLRDIYNSDSVCVSYEVFPPKLDFEEKKEALLRELEILKDFNPAYVSVTYGAGGSTQDKTFEIIMDIKNRLSLNPMPHFTCVNATKENVLEYLRKLDAEGIKNILALRGDPPNGEKRFIPEEGGFAYANELVEFIKEKMSFSIGVAGYPEVHPEAKSKDDDIMNLKRKIDAGGDAIITQVFYDNQKYFDFVKKVKEVGVDTPIIPGILPITSYSQIERMVSLCGATVPFDLKQELEKNKDNPENIKKIGLEFAVEQCRELLKSGVKGLHFYTLNKAAATKKVLESIF